MYESLECIFLKWQVKARINHNVLQVNAKFSGKTPLHFAVAAGKTAIVEALLEMGANIESEVRYGSSLFLITPGEYNSTSCTFMLVIFHLCIKSHGFYSLPSVV